jgi:quercetin 2,3-dioxygenase
MSTAKTLKAAMATLSHAKIVPRRSAERGDANHGWLLSKHSFSFASYYDPRFESFGSIRVLNEDRVAPGSGFPTHPHRDAEIFSYIISGELTHRDSMVRKGVESANKDQFYRMKRGDVQFTTGGTGIAHSEQNEHPSDWVHFLQIWATPWKRGLRPIYHTSTFSEEDKRKGFVNIITPLKAGPKATLEEEKAAVPVLEGTIPVHADLIFSAGIIPQGETFKYTIGGDNVVTSKKDRKIYVHLPMTKGGKSKIRLAGRTDSSAILEEGDAAFVSNVNAGDVLTVESLGEAEAEVIVLDSN